MKYTTLQKNSLKYIDLFCGIGGFRAAMEKTCGALGIEAECLLSSDIDAECQNPSKKETKGIRSWKRQASNAQVAKLVDALPWGGSSRKGMEVRVFSWAR